MKEFPANIKFKYKWRLYQKRVLDELDDHLDDNHLHIVAPPGSGKTILGLEVALRLNRPTLILTPTIAIRNQWIQRFCDLFLQVNTVPNWISRDIRNPQFITVITYQALHAACTNSVIEEDDNIDEESELEQKTRIRKLIYIEEVVSHLQQQEFGTFIVDEAHHLKNEWWRSLNAVKNAINPTVVGLTATPPYDVSYSEWERYIDLNGPVDTEISVPELVVENDLCPHQDYIYLSEPTNEERKQIANHRAKSLRIFEEIKNDDVLIKALITHPAYNSPLENLEWIYNHLESYSSILIFLNAIGKIISEDHIEVIGHKKYLIPKLNFDWLEKLLSLYLYEDTVNFLDYKEHIEKLEKKLKQNGLIDRKKICFKNNKRLNRLLTSSLNKLQSINHIVDIEFGALKKELRMVILTDYIRKEFISNEAVNSLELNKIGVVPIFEQLRRTNDRNLKIGILSGSLIILPQSAVDPFNDIIRKSQLEPITHKPLNYDMGYVIVNINEKSRHNIIHLITSLFESGYIEVLIGTKSLLGEGWDAPSINSLILASFVGSYVLSNQMRGRAIRTDRRNPEKTGNIWHLASVDTTDTDGGEDIQMMKRRFKSFVGISNNDDITIENGINRLNLPNSFKNSEIDTYNAYIIESVGKRELLRKKWKDALSKGVHLVEEIKIPFPGYEQYHVKKSLYYTKTIANLIGMLVSGLIGFAEWIVQGVGSWGKYIRSWESFFYFLAIVGVLGVLLFGVQFYRTFRIYFKYRDISKDAKSIGEALLKTMVHLGKIKTDISKLEVIAFVDNFGAIYCHLNGGNTLEKSTFIKLFQEILSPIKNPRYIIHRKSHFLKIISQSDYHSVPELIGKKKKNAVYLVNQWKKFVGNCELIYTRTIEGRKFLLMTRINSLSSEFVDKSERINKWR